VVALSHTTHAVTTTPSATKINQSVVSLTELKTHSERDEAPRSTVIGGGPGKLVPGRSTSGRGNSYGGQLKATYSPYLITISDSLRRAYDSRDFIPILLRQNGAARSKQTIRWTSAPCHMIWRRGSTRTYASMLRNRPNFFIHSGDNICADGPIAAEQMMPNGQTWAAQ
jgi:hypothetical protein